MGDTIDYVRLVLTFDRHGWDFGHLWWVPSGWLLSAGGRLLLPGTEGDPRTTVLVVLLAINWLCGLASVFLLYAFLVRLGYAQRLSLFVAVVLLFTQGFLNFAQTGSSYVPGLAFVLLALYLALTIDPAGPRAVIGSLASGLALAAAICFWLPYVLVVPAVILAPLILLDWSRQRFWFILRASAALTGVLLVAYGAAMLSLGITDAAGFRAWMARSSHGVITGGAARAVFGLARSFIFMGDDGVLFKRFLLKDPYHPVSLLDLLRLSLWKFLFFYLAMLALAAELLRSAANRRLLALVLIAGLPVVGFGVFWQGGDMERYLPLYPFLFLALAGVLDAPECWRAVKGLVVGFFVTMVLVNGLALSRWQVGRYHRAMLDRVAELRERLTPESHVVIVKDSLKLLPRDFPFDSASRGLPIVEAVTPGLQDSPRWRVAFRETVETTWKNGGDVWISQRLLGAEPTQQSAWVEGDDPRVKWADLHGFFSRLETDEPIGGEDGFVRLVPSQRTRRVLVEEER
jgi:hypothetical protein